MNRLSNRQSGNDMLRADRIAIKGFSARGFSRGSYAGLERQGPKKGAQASEQAAAVPDHIEPHTVSSGSWPGLSRPPPSCLLVALALGFAGTSPATAAGCDSKRPKSLWSPKRLIRRRRQEWDNRWSERWLTSWQRQARG